MSNADNLLTFLRARLDEDTARARAAGEEVGAHWQYDGHDVVARNHPDQALIATGAHDWIDHERGEHIAEWDPARVLREVEAKRHLLYQFEHRGNSVRATVVPSTGGVWDDLLRLLALPYANHPDYQPEWRP